MRKRRRGARAATSAMPTGISGPHTSSGQRPTSTGGATGPVTPKRPATLMSASPTVQITGRW